MDLTGQEKCVKNKEFGNNGAVHIKMRVWVLAQPSDGWKNPEVTLSLPQPVFAQVARCSQCCSGVDHSCSPLETMRNGEANDSPGKKVPSKTPFLTLLTNRSNYKKRKKERTEERKKSLGNSSNVNQRQPGDSFEGAQWHWKEMYSVHGVAPKTLLGKAKELSQGARLAMLFRSLLLVTSRQS